MQASKALLFSNMLSSTESVENADIATFNTSCVCTPDISVDLEPIQAGTGDPSPDNIRPISGRSAVNVYVEETYDAQATPKATIQLGQTVYGGTVDVVSGKMTVDRALYVADGTESVRSVTNHANGLYYTIVKNINAKETNPLPISSRFKALSVVAIGNCYITSFGRILVAVLPDQTATTIDAATHWFAENPTQFVYELATPVEVTLTPQQIQTLQGDNAVWSDAGNISVLNITCNADFLETFLKMKLIGDC